MGVTAQSKGAKKGQAASLGAIFFAVLKVFVSCFAAVMSDATLKKYKLPLYAQLSQLMLPWGTASFFLALFFEPTAMSSPTAFFDGWNLGTFLVMLSFVVKTLLTLTLLKVLDATSRNIGEAVAALVIYAMQVILPCFSQQFQTDTFIAMTAVVMTVTTYMFLKQDIAEAAKQLKAASEQSNGHSNRPQNGNGMV